MKYSSMENVVEGKNQNRSNIKYIINTFCLNNTVVDIIMVISQLFFNVCVFWEAG